MSDGKRGAKRLGRRDWLFGSAPRRRLLEEILESGAPPEGWTKTELALAAGVSPKGGVDEHVAGLAALGLLEARDRRWHPGPSSELGSALRGVLRELDGVV